MQQTDFRRFHAVMTGMAKLYEREIDDAVLDAYWLALRDWPLTEFEAGAGQLMRTSKFMPRPADFTDLRKAARLTSGEAWAKVLHHVRTGAYRWDSGPPTWNENMPKLDPMIESAVASIGGYKAIAMMSNDDVKFAENRFSQHYSEIEDVSETRVALRYAPELENIGSPRLPAATR